MLRILVLNTTQALGDFLFSLPALAALRRAHPEAHIEVVGSGSLIALLADGLVNVSLRDESSLPLHELFTDQARLSPTLSAYLGSFQAVVLFSFGTNERAKRHLIRRGLSVHAVGPLRTAAASRHVTLDFLQAVAPLGADPAKHVTATPMLHPNRGKEFGAVKEESVPFFHEGTVRRVAVHPGSGSPLKNWPPALFGRLIREVARQDLADVLLIRGPAEEQDLLEELDVGDTPILKVLDRPPLTELARVLAGCSAYLGNDSGVSHLAAAVGTPSVVLFGPTDPARWRPLGEHVRVLDGGAFARRSTSSTGGSFQWDLSVEDVLAAVRRCLSSP